MKWDEDPSKKQEEVVIEESKQEASGHKDQVAFKFGKGIKPVMEIPSRKNSIIGVFGDGGSGKTYFSCTAPLPIIVIDTENRLKLVTDQLPPEIQSQIYQFNMIEYGKTQGGEVNYSGMLDKFREEILGAASEMSQSGQVGTIVIDSMSEVIDWYDLWLATQKGVKLGDDGTPLPFEKKKSKSEIRRILDIFRVTQWNIIMTFKEKQLWGTNGAPIDEFAPEWSKDLKYLCDFVVNIRKIGPRREFRLIKNSYGSNLDIPLNNVGWDDFHKIIKEHSGT